MRQQRTVQANLFDLFAGHEIGRELNTMSQWLDEHRDLLGLVARDLSRCAVKATGRQGLPAEAVLRCALLKQYRQLSYQELAFHLEDSASFRAFARLPWSWSPQRSVMQKTIGGIRPVTVWSSYGSVLGTLFAESFSANVRYTGISLGYQIGAALVGGPAPLIATALLVAYNYIAVAGFVVFCAVVSLVAISFAQEMRGKDPDA